MNEWFTRDGRRICYRRAGSGPPLVLVHGWAMSSAVFGEALRGLADQFTVLAPDLPGHGASEGGNDYGLDGLAADLQAWLEGLELRGVHLLGWSLGGQVALRLAARCPQRLERLLLISTTPRFIADEGWSAGLADAQVRLMDRGLQRRFAQTLEGFFAQQFAPGEVSVERRQALYDTVSPAVFPPQAQGALEALETLRSADLRVLLADLALPALVMHGAEDQIIPAAAGRYLAENLPQGRFELLADTGHAPFLSRPQECFALWREFCRP